jgi:hypothetical protein
LARTEQEDNEEGPPSQQPWLSAPFGGLFGRAPAAEPAAADEGAEEGQAAAPAAWFAAPFSGLFAPKPAARPAAAVKGFKEVGAAAAGQPAWSPAELFASLFRSVGLDGSSQLADKEEAHKGFEGIEAKARPKMPFGSLWLQPQRRSPAKAVAHRHAVPDARVLAPIMNGDGAFLMPSFVMVRS